MRALVTGFGPFGSVSENPSESLARRLALRPPEGWDCDCEVLAVQYREARAAVHLLTHRPYDLVLMLGVHNRDTRLYLELFARRQVGPTPDVAGELVGPDWFPPGPDRVASPLFDESVVRDLNDSRFTWSYSAGGYLCNAWYYLGLTVPGGPPCGFVHVPHSEVSRPDGTHLPLAEQESLLRTLLHALAVRRNERKGRTP